MKKKKGCGKYSRENNKKRNPKYAYGNAGLGIGKCKHPEDIWCSECINTGEKIDLREEGLGQGFYITNKV